MRVGSAIASGTRHILGVGLQSLLIVGIIAALALGAAAVAGTAPTGADSVFAAKGGNGGHLNTTATLTVASGAFGSTTTGTAAGGDATWIHAVCYLADGGIGMDSWKQPASDGSFTLQLGPSPSWTSGGASCIADAGTFARNGRFTVDASTTFSVF